MFHTAKDHKVTGAYDEATAVRHLVRVNTREADKLQTANKWEASLAYLESNAQIAKEAGATDVLPDAYYRLGIAYEHAGNPETAIEHLERFMDLSSDQLQKSQACLSLAMCLQKKGDLDSAIQYLQQLSQMQGSPQFLDLAASACSRLGSIYFKQNSVMDALQFFEKAFNLYRESGNTAALNQASVQFGMARGSLLTTRISSLVSDNQLGSLLQLIQFKSNPPSNEGVVSQASDSQPRSLVRYLRHSDDRARFLVFLPAFFLTCACSPIF
eukprot:m.405393 g.405393  ORF g.405393 m.405393 type:complete len:270 (+) comp56489_c0_seq8:779-1588(+)